MNTYELINPHDPYTFQAPDDDVATAAVTILNDMYGWECDDRQGGLLGLGFFGTGKNSDESVVLLASLKATLDERPAEVAAALRSLTLGRAEPSSTVDPRIEALRIAAVLDKRTQVAS